MDIDLSVLPDGFRKSPTYVDIVGTRQPNSKLSSATGDVKYIRRRRQKQGSKSCPPRDHDREANKKSYPLVPLEKLMYRSISVYSGKVGEYTHTYGKSREKEESPKLGPYIYSPNVSPDVIRDTPNNSPIGDRSTPPNRSPNSSPVDDKCSPVQKDSLTISIINSTSINYSPASSIISSPIHGNSVASSPIGDQPRGVYDSPVTCGEVNQISVSYNPSKETHIEGIPPDIDSSMLPHLPQNVTTKQRKVSISPRSTIISTNYRNTTPDIHNLPAILTTKKTDATQARPVQESTRISDHYSYFCKKNPVFEIKKEINPAHAIYTGLKQYTIDIMNADETDEKQDKRRRGRLHTNRPLTLLSRKNHCNFPFKMDSSMMRLMPSRDQYIDHPASCVGIIRRLFPENGRLCHRPLNNSLGSLEHHPPKQVFGENLPYTFRRRGTLTKTMVHKHGFDMSVSPTMNQTHIIPFHTR